MKWKRKRASYSFVCLFEYCNIPITNTFAGDILTFESEAMRDFIAADEDGYVTIILQSTEDLLVDFKSKEHTDSDIPPTLRLVLEPARGTVILIQ